MNKINKIFPLTIIILISFVIIFMSNLIKFDYERVFYDSFERLKTVNLHHRAYSNKEDNKISFIKNHKYDEKYLPRGEYVNQFEFHPYWSIKKGKSIYKNKNNIIRLPGYIENYLIDKNINILEICSYKSNYNDGIQFKNTENSSDLNSQNNRVINIFLKTAILKDYIFLKILNKNKKLIANILINNNDNVNFIKENYVPMIENYSNDNIVIDAYEATGGYVKISIFSKEDKKFFFEIRKITSEDLFPKNQSYNSHYEIFNYIETLSLLNQKKAVDDTSISISTLKCSPKNY